MTFVHTTDSHSKVLPFKYIPVMTDENLGILRCPGEEQLANCRTCLQYEIADLEDSSMSPTVSECSDCMQFVKDEDVCPDCLAGSYDNEACFACIDDVRISQRCVDYTYGGAARVAWAINQERAKAGRFAHVDTGDFYQGAPVFNLFRGEAEVRALSLMGVEASVIGNHEFDAGADRLSEVLYKYATFPVLNANFMWQAADEPGSTQLGDLVQPFMIRDYNGIRIGYIGLGNLRSLNSLGDAGNSMGVRALDTFQVLNEYVPMIRSQVDLVVLLSHLGVSGDMEVASNIPGIDLIFGGHDHVVINPPAQVKNPDGRTTLIVHSGVNYKCIARLDITVRYDGDGIGAHILSHDYTVIPISSETDSLGEPLVGEDPMVSNMLYDYKFELDRAQNLEYEIGTATADFPRYAPGDSPLGNLVATAMRQRQRIETDFSVTNSLGIRADLYKGPITVGKMYEIFPFENTVTTMYLSAPELYRLFDYIAGRTAAYGCKTQVQISGAKTVLNCSLGRVKELSINNIKIVDCYKLVEKSAVFSMATNDYIANGGSGFDILEQNTTKMDTMLSLRDVVLDYIEQEQEISPIEDGRITLIKEETETCD